jgi:hypothetical protein
MKQIIIIFMAAYLFIGLGAAARAQVMQSPSYQLPESYVGPGGGFAGGSANFSSSDTAGDIGIGSASSPNLGTQAGFNTTNEPRLILNVSSATLGFGNFSTAVTSSATAAFSVLNYTSSGYSVFIIGNAPSNGSHNLTTLTGSASQVGVEQYGINLVANTVPAVGANPVQIPSASFAYGAAATGYGTANNYRYVNGEKIAESTKSSGQTNYTVSFIVNTATTTPGGKYAGSASLVVVGTY